MEYSLSCIKMQTTEPDEILVVASGLKSLGCADPTIKVYHFENRMLAGGARNKGGELATGDVVCFCDVDDIIHPQKCEVIKNIFQSQEIDALVHNYNMGLREFDPVKDTHIEKVVKTDPLPSTNVEAPSRLPICHGHMSARKEVLSDIKYREDMSCGEDGVFCQSIVKSSQYTLYYTPLKLINYIT